MRYTMSIVELADDRLTKGHTSTVTQMILRVKITDIQNCTYEMRCAANHSVFFFLHVCIGTLLINAIIS